MGKRNGSKLSVGPTRPSPSPVLNVNSGPFKQRIVIGHPMTGLVRVEWMFARFGQIIPCNWSHMDLVQFLSPYIPLKYQIADAENLIAKAVVENNSEWCFKADTLVTTNTGAVRIRDIEVGDQVLTHLNRFRPVTYKYVRPTKQRADIYWLRTENSTTKVTAGHPYLVKRRGILTFVKAAELVVGDLLCYPQEIKKQTVKFELRYNQTGSGYHNLVGGSRNTQYLKELPVSVDLARFLGLYLAEGHVDRCGIAFTFNSKEKSLIDFVCQFSQKHFRRKASVCVVRSSTKQVRISIGTLGVRFKEWFGTRANTKRIPDFIFDWPLEAKLHLLSSYLDGDGAFHSGLATFSTASQKLSDDVSKLASSCGLLISSVAVSIQRGNYISKGGQNLYSATLSKKSVDKMRDLLNADAQDAGYLYKRVIAVDLHRWAASLKDNNVYNLEVAEDNTYVADCASVHNCLMYEHDNLPPTDAFVKLNDYMIDATIPVVGGVYFTKSSPSEPILYRDIGRGFFADWRLGDKVWCSGVPFGFTLIHGSIIRAMWAESPEYVVNGQVVRRVFEAPQKTWSDPAKGAYQSEGGTSDLAWCKRVMDEGFFEKAGWPKYQKMKYPFLIDTSIFVRHIDQNGVQYPITVPKRFAPLPNGEGREIK